MKYSSVHSCMIAQADCLIGKIRKCAPTLGEVRCMPHALPQQSSSHLYYLEVLHLYTKFSRGIRIPPVLEYSSVQLYNEAVQLYGTIVYPY